MLFWQLTFVVVWGIIKQVKTNKCNLTVGLMDLRFPLRVLCVAPGLHAGLLVKIYQYNRFYDPLIMPPLTYFMMSM